MRKTLIKLTAFLLIILLVISAAPVTVFATNVVLQGDDEIGYYYEMPNVGNLLELNLADRSDGFTFKLYDDGGAADDYSNNCNNSLTITAPKDYVFKISGSGATESVSYDYLTVYDGDTSKMLGNGRFGGSFTMDEVYSTTNVIKVCFKSDYSITDSGYELTVTLLDYSSRAHVNYVYNSSTKTDLIEKGQTIQLKEFSSMFALPERYHFSSWESGGVNYSEGDNITIENDVTFNAVLEEDPVIQSDGEGGYYSKLPMNGSLTADLSDRDVGFTLKVYDHAGKDGNYHSGEGYLLVQAPEGCVLSVNGSGFTYKGYDYLKLFEGDTSNQIGPKFEGQFTMNDYYTTGNVLKIYFYA